MVNNLKLLIKTNFKTFCSIMILTMLGVGFLVGMKSSVPNLKYTIENYFDEYNIYDINLTSSMGFTDEDIKTFKSIKSIKKIEGSYIKDFVVKGNNDEYVLRVHSYINSEDTINNLELISGSLPKNIDEIVVEDVLFKKQNYSLGDTISLDSDLIKNKKLKIVGVIKSPLYLSNNKGSTNLLSGRVNYYAFINFDNIDSDIYSNIYIKTDNIDECVEEIKKLGKEVLDERYKTTIIEYTEKIETGKKEISAKKKETDEKIKSYETELENAELQIESAEKSIPTVDEARITLVNRENELIKVKNQLDTAKAQIDASKEEYNSAKKEFDENKADLDEAKEELAEIKIEADQENRELESENRRLQRELSTASEDEREEILNQIEENNETIEFNNYAITTLMNLINVYSEKMDYYEKELNSAKSDLDAKQYEYDLTLAEYKKAEDALKAKSAEEIIELAKKEVEEKKRLLNEKKKELNENKLKAEKEFEDYQNSLEDASDYLKLISVNGWNINKREDISSYNQYLSDIDRIEHIGNFFPVIFYLVAVLITLTNITRIITNERDTIGLYKALGYSNIDIGNDYIYFSLISSFIGSILGSIVGLFIIPKIFYKVYKIMYFLPAYKYLVDYKIIIIAILIAIVLVFISAYVSIKNTIKEWPAILFRPVDTKGKRVILEKVPFIWNHLNFTNKVTVRNMFKYPKRFIMTILGISGCISLIIAGFNIRTSISNIIPLQFEELFDVDVEVFLKDSLTRSETQLEKERINSLDEVSESVLSYIRYVYINNTESKAYLVSPEDNDLLLDFVSLRDKNKKYELSDDGVIVTRKLSKVLGLKVGDTINLKDSDNNVFDVKINAIVDNYVDNYIYMSRNYYNSIIGSYPKYNALLVRTNDNYNEEDLSLKFNENNNVSYLVYTSTSKIMYDTITKSLNYIVYILVISAVILAFIVLYNLNNLNVDERKREIATIKVLGFYKKETYRYIENEIKRLTLIGIIIGIFLGYIFSNILVKNCELDNLMYDYSINYLNYIYAIIITIIFMVITYIIGRKNIRKIDMIESLKKVE